MTTTTEKKKKKKPTEVWRGTGRRKCATARVIMKPGSGVIMINKKTIEAFFKTSDSQITVLKALKHVDQLDKFDITCTVQGGGTTGQAEAISLGIARCLIKFNPELDKPLRKAGFLMRDPRMVERKKYGQPGARKRFQFSKR